jgi:hypothetical protein
MSDWTRNVVPVDTKKVAGMLAEIDLDLGDVVAFLTSPRPNVRTSDFEQFAKTVPFKKYSVRKATA